MADLHVMNKPIPAAIEVRHVVKRFGTVTALDDVSLSIPAGEMFFLLGPSGCGKTTLLRILAGLEAPDSGTVYFNGRDVAELPAYERGAPMVFQNYALWPHLNVRDNVAFGLVERHVPKPETESRTQDVLNRVGLAGLGGRMPGQLSGGQQQRVVLARALVLNPAVILLDEPLSNLDAKLRVEMRLEIEKLRRDTNITFVYVTHDQADALALADRMAVMHAGKVSAMGTPLELYARPPNVFCADFLGEANFIEGVAKGMTVQTQLGNWVFHEDWLTEDGSPYHESAPSSGRARRPAEPGDMAGACVCLVRPENIQCVENARSGVNAFEADITDVRVNGATVTVSLLAAEMPLKATVLTQRSLGFRKGERRWWAVAPENVVLLSP
jgi:iron(III) transport system ATP-binding protein